MANEPRRMQFDDFLEQVQSIFDMLARQKEPVVVERKGRLFRVEAEQKDAAQALWADYDGERVRTALRQSAGAFNCGATGSDRGRTGAAAKAQASPVVFIEKGG